MLDLFATLVGLVLGSLVGALWLERRRRHRAEVDARRCLAMAAHLDRRAAMGQLTASLTHELHQPLGAILRNSEAATLLLASGRSCLAEIQDIAEDIRMDVRRAAAIIRRTRTLLHKQELSEEPVDFNEVVRDTIELVAQEATSRRARVEMDLHTAPVIVTGDRVHLQQVLMNLVLNGLDAMTQTPAERRRLILATVVTNDRVDVSVQDGGSGIPDESIEQVFEPFFTTKTDGMGLGLSIARSIIEAHHGRVVAQNNPEGGATVRFSLPLRRRGRSEDGRAHGQPHAA